MRLSTVFFIVLQYVLPQTLLSRVVGKLAASEVKVVKKTFIQQFARKYNIDMSIAENPDLGSYASFNAFFTRALKPGVRAIDSAPLSVVSPADGVISQLGAIQGDAVFQAKGKSFSLNTLLSDKALAKPFVNGNFATVYLSPKDYHRVHMPFVGTLTDTIYIPGELFSVNTVTAENVDGLFARNERLVCLFDTERGRMAVVMVGAMIVAGIECVATGKIKPTGSVEHTRHTLPLAKGDELGRFYLGSTAIVLFERNVMQWNETLSSASAVKMGEAIGTIEKNR